MHAALLVKPQCQHRVLAVFQLQVVQHRRVTIGHQAARPIPFFEGSVNRFIAFVAVQVSMALPRLTGVLQLHFNAGAGCDRSPTVQTLGLKVDTKIEQLLRMHAHTTLDASGKGHADFVNVHHQGLTIPMQLAGSNVEVCLAA